jgi:membrane protein
VIGAALLILVTLDFALYVQKFGSYDRIYGNLGAAVGFLTWIWISLVVLLTGAELDCEIERGRRAGARP